MKISTDVDATCRYGTFSGADYSSMQDFDLSYGKIHEKSFTGLENGVYNYYIKCINSTYSASEPLETRVFLRVNPLVNAQISLSKEAPLNFGRTDVTLLTSRLVSGQPTLSYSFDSSAYNNLPLSGSEKIWKGYLIIPGEIGNAVLSFKFKANDLEGREGSEITKGGTYVVDTLKPQVIGNIEATGYDGKIKLEWHFDNEDYSKFNIYRSDNPNPGYSNFYKNVEKSPFEDTLVERGKTYYYRVSAVDLAGNEGDLSIEVYATALLSGLNNKTQGLSIDLVGKVDNFLTEINSVIEDSKRIKEGVSTKQETEKELFLKLEFDKQIDADILELNSLKKDVETYKLQDLSKEELEKKIDSLRLKLNIIKKKVPEGLTISSEGSKKEEITSEIIDETILEIYPEITDKQREQSLEQTLKLIEEHPLSIESHFYSLEILYLDGTNREFSFIKKIIESDFEEKDTDFFIEKIPKEVAETSSEIDLKNLDYKVLKEDPIFSFKTGTKEITYSIAKKISPSSLETTRLIFLSLANNNSEPFQITGYSILGPNKITYIGASIGILFILFLAFYLFYLRKHRHSELFFHVADLIKEAVSFLEKGDMQKMQGLYDSIKEDYANLNDKEKRIAYKQIEELNNKFLAMKIKKGLDDARVKKDEKEFFHLEKAYKNLPVKIQKEVDNFEAVKKDFAIKGGNNEKL